MSTERNHRQSIKNAEAIVGEYDWKPLDAFGRDLSPVARDDEIGKRKVDLGPVTRDWPEDGNIHCDRGLTWALGQHKYEAVTALLLLLSFWTIVVVAWWLTALMAEQIPSVSGVLLSWLVFAAIVYVARIFLLLLTPLVLSVLATLISAKSDNRREHEYE
jgi:hypothetical protein